jgi:hypothetical protein
MLYTSAYATLADAQYYVENSVLLKSAEINDAQAPLANCLFLFFYFYFYFR